jgi:HEAT repeat protein
VLKDEDWLVRKNSAEALGQIGDTRAIEALIAALKDNELKVRLEAADALNRITSQYFDINPADWQAWWEKNIKPGNILESKTMGSHLKY